MGRKRRGLSEDKYGIPFPIILGTHTNENDGKARDAIIGIINNENSKGFKSGCDILICGLDGSDIKRGDKEFDLKNVDWVKADIHIINKDTLGKFIETLQELYDKWNTQL